MRISLLATVAICLAGSGHAAPAMPTRDANEQCVIDNFQRTNAILEQSHKLGSEIRAELEKPSLEWAKLRQLIVRLRHNDILFRNEMYRVELKCLDAVSEKDRISSLKSEFREIQPPPILQVKPTSK
jgi:hypothetical protein